MHLVTRSTTPFSCTTPQELCSLILVGRNITDVSLFDKPSLKQLDSPFSLLNIDKAIHRVICALESKETIAVLTDHDCDGQTGCAVLMWTLKHVFDHPLDRTMTYIGHRTQEG